MAGTGSGTGSAAALAEVDAQEAAAGVNPPPAATITGRRWAQVRRCWPAAGLAGCSLWAGGYRPLSAGDGWARWGGAVPLSLFTSWGCVQLGGLGVARPGAGEAVLRCDRSWGKLLSFRLLPGEGKPWDTALGVAAAHGSPPPSPLRERRRLGWCSEGGCGETCFYIAYPAKINLFFLLLFLLLQVVRKHPLNWRLPGGP